jgi:hypothetical protein
MRLTPGQPRTRTVGTEVLGTSIQALSHYWGGIPTQQNMAAQIQSNEMQHCESEVRARARLEMVRPDRGHTVPTVRR